MSDHLCFQKAKKVGPGFNRDLFFAQPNPQTQEVDVLIPPLIGLDMQEATLERGKQENGLQEGVRCLFCLKPFNPKRRWAKFCNASCRVRYYRKKLNAGNNASEHTHTAQEIDTIAKEYV